MATTLVFGEQITVLAELGFIVREFTLGDYGTKVTRTNLVTNPSFETNTTGWTTSNATITRITTDSYAGGACCQVSKLAVANGRIRGVSTTSGDRIPVTAGTAYRFSWWVKVPTGQPSCSLRIRTEEYQASGTRNPDQVSSTTVVSDTDGWVRLSFSDTPVAGATPTVTMVTSVEETTANARTYLVDAAMVEQTNTLLPYFDGSFDAGWSGYILDGALSWSGTAHASTSSGTWGLIGTETNGSQLDGDDVLDGTLEGLDISEFVQSLSISRGRSDQFNSFRAGTCTLVLNNNDRRFDPINTASPYYDPTLQRHGVTPRRKVTITSGALDLFVGRISDIDVQYDFDLSTVVITCTDDFTLLATTFTGAAITPTAELSGARVTSILDLASVNFPAATRSIDTGVASLGNYQIPANTNAAGYLSRVAEAEQGLFFVKADGTLRFTDRVSNAFAVSAASFSDDGTDIPYQGLATIYGNEFLFNRVQATRETGSVQAVGDAASQTEFGVSTLALDDLLLADDASALTLATSLLDRYKAPEYRFDDMTVMVSALSAPNRTTVLGLEMGDVITVTRHFATGSPASVSDDYGVERITHQITPDRHLVTIGMYVADLVFPFVLNDATFGVLSTDNALV